MTHDVLIRGGVLVDGTGAEPFLADVAIQEGRIAAIGSDLGSAHTEIDASDCLVTPGFVDIHTHYDGQVTWENRLVPSSYHGVTTAIIGNCGVGFAPCRPGDRDKLVQLMEGVEDIPYPVLAQGLPWTWETYPQYLDLLGGRSYDMDIVSYVPHAALRIYVMGDRGLRREAATPEDIEQMCAILADAMDAGALGLATSQTLFHRSSTGEHTPTYQADDGELLALANVLRMKNKGVFQIVEDMHLPDASLERVRKLARASGRPVTFPVGVPNAGPAAWPRLVKDFTAANAAGEQLWGQLMPRGIGMILGVELTLHPFYSTPTYQVLHELPLAERLAEMRKPEVRQQILSESLDPNPKQVLGSVVREWNSMFLLGDRPDYEQPPEASIAGMARARGVAPEALAYDILVRGETGGKLYLAMANFRNGTLDAVGEILKHPNVVLGLGDGGAHVGTICDASYSTFALTHWARDRHESQRTVADIIRRLTSAPATVIGLEDRGRLAPGLRADINVIAHDQLGLLPPEVHYDLPGGGRRLIQKAIGYEATLVSGEVVYRGGEHTGALPGRLVRNRGAG